MSRVRAPFPAPDIRSRGWASRPLLVRYGGVAKWLRQWIANPRSPGSNPGAASSTSSGRRPDPVHLARGRRLPARFSSRRRGGGTGIRIGLKIRRVLRPMPVRIRPPAPHHPNHRSSIKADRLSCAGRGVLQLLQGTGYAGWHVAERLRTPFCDAPRGGWCLWERIVT